MAGGDRPVRAAERPADAERRPPELAEAAYAYSAGRLDEAIRLANLAAVRTPATTVGGSSARLLAAWAAIESHDPAALVAATAGLDVAPEGLRTALPAYLIFAEAHGLAASGETTKAAEHFSTLATKLAKTAPGSRARWWLARHDPGRGLPHLEVLLRKPPRWLDRAEARLTRAVGLRAAGKSSAAIAAAVAVIVSHPASAAADRAARLLEELAGSDWRPRLLTATKHLSRLDALIRARHWHDACPDVAARWKDGPKAPHFLRSGELHARCLSKFKRFEEAGELYEALSARARKRGLAAKTATLLLKAAKAHAGRHKLEENPERAVEIYDDFAARYPGDERTPETRFMAAYLLFNLGESKQALARLEAFVATYPKDKRRWPAIWYSGWIRYLDGDCAGALPHFTALAATGGALRGDKGAYWRARCLARTGKEATAAALWGKIAKRSPFGYYGLLSRLRLKERGIEDRPFGLISPPAPPSAPAPKDDTVGEAAFRYALLGSRDAEVVAALPKGATTPAARLGLALLGAGLRPEAAAALGAARKAVSKAGGKGGTRASLTLLQAAGDHATTRRIGATLAGIRRPPIGPDAGDWAFAFPMAFADEVRAAATKHGVDEYLVAAIMHKESGFNPRAVSYADALGLMQILPKTGRKIAARRGIDFTESMLFDPVVNIDFAAWYLAELRKRFSGQLILAVPAYNGGPLAVSRWLDAEGARPFDEFVETITYFQSREYTKKVAALYARYVYRYGGEIWLPPTVIDPRYGDSIDF